MKITLGSIGHHQWTSQGLFSLKNIKITAIASDFDFVGGSIGAAEGEAFLYGIQQAIENKQPFITIQNYIMNKRVISILTKVKPYKPLFSV